jgi:hypothetical protein
MFEEVLRKNYCGRGISKRQISPAIIDTIHPGALIKIQIDPARLSTATTSNVKRKPSRAVMTALCKGAFPARRWLM